MRAVVIALFCAVSTAAFAQSPPLRLSPPLHQLPPRASTPAVNAVPLPRPRPPEAGPRAVEAGPDDANREPAAPSECFLALTAGLAIAAPLPPIAEPNGCEAPDVVRLDAVIVQNQRRVSINPPATLRCEMATAIAQWLRGDLATMVAPLGAPLAGIENYDSFDCRGQNRIAGAKTSEHGRANALDIRALLLASGLRVELTNPEVARTLRENVRRSACARFTTVLGPGSDGYHENHVHVDLAERRNGFRLCQWDVLDPTIPLPRDRPIARDP